MQSNFIIHDVRRLAPVTLGLVVLAHAGVILALSALHVSAVSIPETALLVEVIQSAPEKLKAPEVRPPKPTKKMLAKTTPRVVPPAPVVEAPVLATEHPAAPALADLPKVAARLPVPAAPAAPPPASPAPTTPSAPSAPRFDADYLENPAPAYPSLARRAGEQGKVILRVFVAPSGLPSRIEVRTSSGFERLDKSAINAVGRWKFIPARQGADAIGAWVLVPISFSLKA